jgi:hypothetical protein
VKVKTQRDSSSEDPNFEDELAGDDKINTKNMSESLAKPSLKNKGKPIQGSIQTQPHLKE